MSQIEMRSTNILFVSAALNYFESSATNRNRLLVKKMQDMGCDVYSIEFTGEHCKEIGKIPLRDDFRINVSGFRELSPSSDVGKRRSLKSFAVDMAKKFIPDRLFLRLPNINFLPILKKFGVNFDLVITSSDPKGVHLFSRNVTARQSPYLESSTFVQYWGDPLNGDVNGYNNVFMKFIEGFLFKKSDYVFFVSEPTMKDKCRQFTWGKDKFGYLPRIISVPSSSAKPNLDLAKLQCCYVGDFYKISRDIEPLVEAFELDATHDLVVVGNGDCVKRKVLDNILFRGRVSLSEAEKVVASSDVCFVVLNKLGTQIPGKIYDLATTDKTIIVVYEQEQQLNDIPFKDRFLFCKNEKSSILKTLVKLSSLDWSHPISEYGLGESVLSNLLFEVKNN